MSRAFVVLSILVVLTMFCAMAMVSIAFGQQPLSACGPHDVMMSMLRRQFGEYPLATAVTEGSLFILLVNPDTRTMTVLRVRPDLTTCIMIGARNFEIAVPRGKRDEHIGD